MDLADENELTADDVEAELNSQNNDDDKIAISFEGEKLNLGTDDKKSDDFSEESITTPNRV